MDRCTQLEELDSLKSIYYSEEFQVLESSNETDKLQAIFWAFVALPDKYSVKYFGSLDSPEPSYLKVKHLPPIELRLILPEDYPSKNPPEFTISCQWLFKTKISLLCQKLDDIWCECGPAEIIYSWCDFLKNESLTFLTCENELDITEMCLKHLNFVQKLEDDEERKKAREERREFKENKFSKTSGNQTTICEEGNESHVKENELIPIGDHNETLCVDKSDPSYSSVPLKEFRNQYNRQNTNQRRHFGTTNFNKSCSRFDKRAVLNLSLRTSPIKVIENYNIEREKVEFLRNFYTCKICFSDKLGKDCTQFKDCEHVFCIDCIRSYFTVRIKDGTVQSIKCPEEKCSSEALPSQVKEIVSEELFAKYDSVLLNTALDTLSDIIYCPRQICQYPVSWEPEEKMASCPNCEFVFCVTCKMVYHGVEPCQIKTAEVKKLLEEYEKASDEVRQQMESKFGKKHLESLLNNSKAEAWIRENSKACPHCEAAIEKSQGCNKMVCWKCNSPFCWLCCQILDPKNPYSHFNDPGSRCANKLFHLVYESDDDDVEWDWVDENDDNEGGSDGEYEGYYFMVEDNEFPFV